MCLCVRSVLWCVFGGRVITSTPAHVSARWCFWHGYFGCCAGKHVFVVFLHDNPIWIWQALWEFVSANQCVRVCDILWTDKSWADRILVVEGIKSVFKIIIIIAINTTIYYHNHHNHDYLWVRCSVRCPSASSSLLPSWIQCLFSLCLSFSFRWIHKELAAALLSSEDRRLFHRLQREASGCRLALPPKQLLCSKYVILHTYIMISFWHRALEVTVKYWYCI